MISHFSFIFITIILSIPDAHLSYFPDCHHALHPLAPLCLDRWLHTIHETSDLWHVLTFLKHILPAHIPGYHTACSFMPHVYKSIQWNLPKCICSGVSQFYTFRQVIHISKYCLYHILGAYKIAINSLSTCCKSRQCEISVNYKPGQKISLSQPKSPLCCWSHYLLPPFHQFLCFESKPWSLSFWVCCVIWLWGVIRHSIISHLPSHQAQYCLCSALERRYAIPDVFTWFQNVPACIHTSSLPVLLCHSSA